MLRSVTSISLGLTRFAKKSKKNVYKKQKIEKKKRCIKNRKGRKKVYQKHKREKIGVLKKMREAFTINIYSPEKVIKYIA